MDSQKFNESLRNLEDLGIFQLRELAREIGVHLPTTLRKNELIQKIREVASGETKPFVSTTKKGRPPKQFQTAKENEEEIREYNYRIWGKAVLPYTENSINFYSLSDNPTFLFDEKKYATVLHVSGIVSVDEQGNARLHEGILSEIGQKRIARIELPVVNKFDLRDGDYVEGRIGESFRDGAYCLFEVNTINGQPYPVTRSNFADSRALPVDTKLNLDKLLITKYIAPIGKGQRVLIESRDRNLPKKFLNDLGQEFSKFGKIFYIKLDDQPEDFFYTDNENFEYILCPFDLPVEKQLYILELAINRAKRLAEQGQDVAVIVENLYTVARLYSRCYKTNGFNNIDEIAIDNIKKLLATGRKIENGGSVTFFGGVENTKDLSYVDDLLYEIKKACNGFIVLNTGSFFGLYDFNIQECYSLNQERLLDNNSLQKAFKIRQETEGKSVSDINSILSK